MMFRLFSGWACKRWPWGLLAVSALALELTALYFQYVMKLDPCMMCVYERAATFGIMFAGLLGMLQPKWLITRLGAYLLWAYCAIKGLLLALEHVSIQYSTNPFASTCDFFPNFWLPLDSWMPWLFAPTGYCDEIQWMFLGMSMPQWLVVCYAIYAVILGVLLISRGIVAKRP